MSYLLYFRESTTYRLENVWLSGVVGHIDAREALTHETYILDSFVLRP